MIENGERRPQVPTWSVANSKESQSALQPDHVTGLDVQKPETRLDLDNSNGSNAASADADAISDIDELLTGGDAEPEPPRYDGDFDIERHDYWWNLLDMENPRHSRASKGMRYGQERNPRCDTCERQNRACMTRPNSHDKTGCVRCSYTQSGCSHAREARESHVGQSSIKIHDQALTLEQQQRTGFPLLKAGGARKRDELDDDDSRSPPAEGVTNKRPRLSSYSTGFPEGRGSNATPSRPAFDAPSVNGRHISPLHVTGSIPERERTGANGGSVRSNRHDAQYYDSHTEVTRHEDRYQQSDRYEISARDLNNVLDLVQKLQREVRTLRSRLDGMETRVDNISGAVDI
jgi:Zn ribbon nucleic-acid-binding protein